MPSKQFAAVMSMRNDFSCLSAGASAAPHHREGAVCRHRRQRRSQSTLLAGASASNGSAQARAFGARGLALSCQSPARTTFALSCFRTPRPKVKDTRTGTRRKAGRRECNLRAFCAAKPRRRSGFARPSILIQRGPRTGRRPVWGTKVAGLCPAPHQGFHPWTGTRKLSFLDLP